MLRKLQRTILFIFLIATIMSITTTIYTFNAYSRTYIALRKLDISVSEFNVEAFNTTYAQTETILTLNNPFPQELYICRIEQGLYLNGEFFIYKRPPEPNELYPMEMLPDSSINVTIKADVPPGKIVFLQEVTQKNWFTTFRILLKESVMGRFWYEIKENIDSSSGSINE